MTATDADIPDLFTGSVALKAKRPLLVGHTEPSMVRGRLKLLGRFVIETTRGHQQEVRVIGGGSRVMFD